jgi:hypothetical protein
LSSGADGSNREGAKNAQVLLYLASDVIEQTDQAQTAPD